MGVWLGPRNSSQVITDNDFAYTSGEYIFAQSGKNWEIALLSSGTLTFFKEPGKIDIFIVGGGQDGYISNNAKDDNINRGPVHGGYGGNGGECITWEKVKINKNVQYGATIGGGGENSQFSIGNDIFVARAGNGKAGIGKTGGKGGYIGTAQLEPTRQPAGESPDIDGVYAYGKSEDTMLIPENQFEGHRFGGAGAGGGAMRYGNESYGPAWTTQPNGGRSPIGGESNGPSHTYGSGGYYYSGQAASAGNANGTNGYKNHGQGGGGALHWAFSSGSGKYGANNDASAFGKGGSGIILIRNHRS